MLKNFRDSTKSVLSFFQWMKKQAMDYLKLTSPAQFAWTGYITRPQEIDPCKHMFCQTCLIRLSYEAIDNCPLCRGAINDTKFNRELNQKIRNQYLEDYLSREKLGEKSSIFLIPRNGYWQIANCQDKHLNSYNSNLLVS